MGMFRTGKASSGSVWFGAVGQGKGFYLLKGQTGYEETDRTTNTNRTACRMLGAYGS